MATKAGDVELKIPKLRWGSYFPSLLEPRRRIDQALYAVVMQAYVEGVSTRSVDDLVQALGVDSGISKSEVSRICRRLDDMDSEMAQPGDHQPPFANAVALPLITCDNGALDDAALPASPL